jgi:hypothetical protein
MNGERKREVKDEVRSRYGQPAARGGSGPVQDLSWGVSLPSIEAAYYPPIV